jgi:hypothetical protein
VNIKDISDDEKRTYQLHNLALNLHPMMIRKLKVLLVTIVVLTNNLLAQSSLHRLQGIMDTAYRSKKTMEPVRVDGVLNEKIWQTSQIAGHFIQNFPTDTVLGIAQTEVMISYDDNFFYIAAKGYNSKKNQSYIIPSLKRDFRGEANDAIVVSIDPFMDRTNSFSFGMSPYGVQREGLVVNGGASSEDLSLSWDNKWLGESKIYEDYWCTEMAIPLNTLRFKNGAKQWLINIYRIDSYNAEKSTWARVPVQYNTTSLAFSKPVIFETPIEKKGPNISLIPYTSPSLLRRAVNNNGVKGFKTKNNINFGGDAKIGLGPSLNLDLTVNPDFSQVEVDNQVTNLDRFEILFPEKRQFFLENGDLFANFGVDGIRPFFSRRIGVLRDQTTGLNVQNKIDAGLRLSGKLNNNLRLGVLHMRTAAIDSINEPANNFSVLTLQQRVFARSSIGMIVTNKDAVGSNHFNRVAGVDYNIASKDNVWNGKLFYMKSFGPLVTSKTGAWGATMIYNKRTFESKHSFSVVDDQFNPEVGFLRRTGYKRISGITLWKKYPKSTVINKHGPGIDYDFTAFPGRGLTDYDINLVYGIQFKKFVTLQMQLRRDYTKLLNDFDPTNTKGEKLKANTSYSYFSFKGDLTTDFRKKLAAKLQTRSGQYFNGTRLNLDGEVTYRIQPYGSISSVFSFNKLTFPKPYKSANLILVGPKIDLTFTKSLFLSTLIQYNNQINNVNMNIRFQWRFAPASDLFLVYTDNYYADTYLSKGSALVLKATYWFNL